MPTTVDTAVAAFEARLPLAVAYSAGADSTALLVAAARRWPSQVSAVHVNHGLQAAAAQFEHHCETMCAALAVPLQVIRVDGRHSPGESPEDAARRARYEAIHQAALARGIATVCLAQHADDQVETVLLALSRGAGVAGLAGMRPSWQRDGVQYARPLLGVAAPDIRQWLRAQGIAWLDDPTNASERFTRNRIRARIMPALAESFPAFRDTFARSARHAAQAQDVLDEVAAADLRAVGSPLQISKIRELTRARQANMLRHWLKSVHEQQASAAQMDELLDQLAACATRGHRIRLRVGHGFVTREQDGLAFTPSV